MSLIKPQDRRPNRHLSISVSAELGENLDAYASFTQSSITYIIAETLRHVFNSDAGFKKYLSDRRNRNTGTAERPARKTSASREKNAATAA